MHEPRDDEDEERPRNPREGANVLSILFFGYTLTTFRLGCRRELSESDIYQPLKEHSSKSLGDRLEEEWNRQLLKKEPSLNWALFRVFGARYFRFCGILIFLMICRLTQPISLYYLLLYYVPDQTKYTTRDSYIFASAIVGASVIFVNVAHPYLMGLQHMGMKMRVACSALVYRKCLRLNKRSLEATGVGQMINLLSNDVNRFDSMMIHLPYLCVCPFELIALITLFYVYVGYSSVPGLALYGVLIPAQAFLGPMFSKLRQRTALNTDRRVHLMSEIINGIRVIKMHAMELSFAKAVESVRRMEAKTILKGAYVKSLIYSFSLYVSRLAVFLCVLTATLSDRVPSASVVFCIVAFFNVLRQSITIVLPIAIVSVAETMTTVRRLQKFLLNDEVRKNVRDHEKDSGGKVGITIKNATCTWGSGKSGENTLQGINFVANSGDLIALIGSVGSGKSSLLNVILDELRLTSGTVTVNGTISYASQDPWIFNSNIRTNILFGQKYNYERYNRVIEVCALKRDFSLFPYGDETLLGERGVTMSGGQKSRINLARAVYKEADIYLLDDPLSAVDVHVGNQIFDECITNFLEGKCVVLVTHQIQYVHMLPRIVMLQNGRKFFEGNYSELQSVAPTFTKILDTDDDAGHRKIDVKKKPMESASFIRPSVAPNAVEESRKLGKVKCAVYKAYFKSGGNFFAGFLMIGLLVLAQVLMSGGDYFLTFWIKTEQGIIHDYFPRHRCIYIYTTLTIVMIVVVQGLHDLMFKRIVKAPILFFDQHPCGRILNRFSKDLGTVDEQLPVVTLETLQIGLQVFGVMLLTGISSPVVIVPLLVILVIFYFLRILYLKVSRNVKRLEGITKSPLFTHINSTLHGLVTIRAFKAENLVIDEFDKLEDVHSSTYHLFITLSRAFGFVLDFFCSLYIGFVTFSFLIFLDKHYGGDAGLAITQSLTLTGMFQWGIRQWSELENQMTCVERIHEFTVVDQETNSLPTVEVSPNWPQNGNIEFRNVSLRYSRHEPLVLKNLSFKIEAQEKVGIIGRTGAGKSSLIGSLFQLTPTKGEILIDGINTQTIPLGVLRPKISIIPQEPVLFAGTLRQNLDPFEEYSDNRIWQALEKVELKSLISDLPLTLLAPIFAGGVNFSVGQRQLLCLARAILKENKIIVLDEATANVDRFTDALIQTTIRNKCKFSTVLTIAHRLETIVDCDKVIVMDDGRAKQIGHPHELLQDTDGIFYGMVQEMGKTMAQDFSDNASKVCTNVPSFQRVITLQAALYSYKSYSDL